MEPREAKNYHSLGEEKIKNEQMNQNSCVCTEVWTHDTGVFLDSGKKKGNQKKSKRYLSFFWRCNTGLASIYRPIYDKRKEIGREGVRSIFVVRRGGSGYSLFLAFRILRMHICQLSSRKAQKTKVSIEIEPSEVKRAEIKKLMCWIYFEKPLQCRIIWNV